MVWPWYGMEWFRWWMISMVWYGYCLLLVWRWVVCWTSIADRSYLLLAQVRRASERLKVDLWHRSLFVCFLHFFSDIQTCPCPCPCICVIVFIWCVFVKLCTSIYEKQMYQKYPTCWSAVRSSLAAQGLFCKSQQKTILLFARFLSDFLSGLAYSCILTGPH